MDHSNSIRRLYDLINAGDIDGFGRQVAEDFVEHEELPGLPPTKDDGLAREHWGVVDQLALMQQLGVIPAGAPA